MLPHFFNVTPAEGQASEITQSRVNSLGWLHASRSLLCTTALALGFYLSLSATAASWSSAGSLITSRTAHQAILLSNGRLLAVGGFGIYTGPLNDSTLSAAEVYDASTDAWVATGAMATRRCYYTATLLPDGRVLAAGGENGTAISPTHLASVELYNPTTQLWSPTSPMSTARWHHTATRLANGKVLVAGGLVNSTQALASAEIYDPATETWSPTGSMSAGRAMHTATLLADGTVLVLGGSTNGVTVLSGAELYDPNSRVWTTITAMYSPRYGHAATLLTNGMVLVAAGYSSNVLGLRTSELYDPTNRTWTSTSSLTYARAWFTTTLLPSGFVLASGGANQTVGLSAINTTELYDPATQRWTVSGVLVAGRSSHTANLLPNGRVLVAGGQGPNGVLSAAELYDMTSSHNPQPFLTIPALSGSGSFQFMFTNTPGGIFTVCGSTNPALASDDWSVLGVAIEVYPGHYQFTDPQPGNSSQRYYRVWSP